MPLPPAPFLPSPACSPPTAQWLHSLRLPHPSPRGSLLAFTPEFYSLLSKAQVGPTPTLLLPSKFCLAGSLPKPLVPTIFPFLRDSPPPAQQPQGWAGAIFSLGTELILTHPQGTWGRAVG